jgi:glucose-1-phosphate thymidylyltransferase
VRIEAGAVVERSTIGPNVTIEAGAVVRDSVVRHAIVGSGARLAGATVEESLIGDDAVVEHRTLTRMVAAKDEVGPAR